MLTKSERNALVVLVVVIVVAGAAFLVMQALDAKRAQDMLHAREAAGIEIPLGETLTVNSSEDEKGVAGDDGYVTGFFFDGSMEMTLEQVYACTTLPDGKGPHDFDRAYDGFVVGVMRLKNIDAQPRAASSTHPYRFNVTGVFRIDGEPAGIAVSDPSYFSGTPEDAGPKEGYAFDLEPGEEKSLVVAYGISFDEMAQGCAVDFYAGINEPRKYRFVSGLTTDDIAAQLENEGEDDA